jgi:hypothetical protein
MICKHCGYELPSTAKFCRSCGKPQLAELLVASEEPAPVIENFKIPSASSKSPAIEEAALVKPARARAKAPATEEAAPVKPAKARAKAPANAEAAPVKPARASAKTPAIEEAAPVKPARARAKTPAIEEAAPVKPARARAKAPVLAPAAEPARVDAELETIATLESANSIPVVKSKLLAYLAIASILFAFVCAAGYWGWTQRVQSEGQKNLANNSQVEEERLKKEAVNKAKQEAEVETAKKEQEEGNAKTSETSSALKWTGRYQCSELLSLSAKVRNEFAVDIAFTTTSGKGVFFRRSSDIVEKFTVDINGTKVDIASEGNRLADPSKKWFTRTTGTLIGKTINTSGSMYGADGQLIIRQNCKIQVNQ